MTAPGRGHVYREVVAPGEAGRSLADHLSAKWRHSTRAEWCERIESGRVRVDDRRAAPNQTLAAGAVVTWARPAWTEPEAPRGWRLLHEDDAVLGVSKPAGLPVLPGAGFLRSTLLEAVRAQYPEAAPVHRLGRWTSGVMVFGRTPAARAALGAAWSDSATVKRYRLLAAGAPSAARFVVDTPIGPVAYPPIGKLHAAAIDGKEARTRFEVVERREGEYLADAFLETGRPHQIRIHLASVGTPLVGDPLFVSGGRPRDGGTALPGDPGYLLHAAEVRVPHPDGGELRLVEEPPEALRAGQGAPVPPDALPGAGAPPPGPPPPPHPGK